LAISPIIPLPPTRAPRHPDRAAGTCPSRPRATTASLGNHPHPRAFPSRHDNNEGQPMRGILLWLIGIPIPIIILLYLFGVF
jgi:hypothetical protein